MKDKRVVNVFLSTLFTLLTLHFAVSHFRPLGPEVAQLWCDVSLHPSIIQNRLCSNFGRGEICVICLQILPPLSLPATGVVTGTGTKMSPLCLIK